MATTTPSTAPLQWYSNTIGDIKPLISDLITTTPSGSKFRADTITADPTAVQERLKQYSVYSPESVGGLYDYLKSYSPSIATSSQFRKTPSGFYMKPGDLQARLSELSGISSDKYDATAPLLGGLQSVGTSNGTRYYKANDLTNQLNRYATFDPSNYMQFSDVAGLKPVTTLDGKKYYNRSELEPIVSAKRRWGTIDPTVAKLLGTNYGKDELGEYTTNLVDPTKYRVGLGDYRTQDIGKGKYNILDAQGNVLGTGYKTAGQAADEIIAANRAAQAPAASTDPNSIAGILAKLKGSSFGNAGKPVYNWKAGDLVDWENLGQALGGATGYSAARQYGMLPGNNKAETISGENTLYGSTPIFYDGKLIGYKANLAARPDSGSYQFDKYDLGQWNPLAYQQAHNTKSETVNTSLSRNINPEAYKGLVGSLGGTEVFAPLANVSKLPGWTNEDVYNYQKTGGLLANFNAFMNKVDPINGWVENNVAKLLGYDNGLDMVRQIGEPVGNIAGALFSYGVPWGSIVAGADAVSRGDNKALGNAAINGIASYVGANMPVSSVAGTGVSLGSNAANAAANQALLNAAATGARGGTWSDVGNSALSGAISGGLGGYMQGSNLSPLTKVALSGGAGALRSALTGGNIGQGALSGLAGSALNAAMGGLGNSANRSGYGTAYNVGSSIANPIIQNYLRKQLYK